MGDFYSEKSNFYIIKLAHIKDNKMRNNIEMMITLLLLSTTIAGQGLTETITFKSANPFGFRDVITALDQQEEQDMFGYLSFPESADKDKYPLVIGAAGSLGWSEHHYEYFKRYREMGIATFEMKSFMARSVESTVGTQVEVTLATMVLDAYRALAALSEHPKIDKDKIAITGWSLGAGVTLFSGWLPAKNAIESDLSFAAHLALYPPCFVEPEVLDFVDSPIHILIGELDNWTPADACVDLVDKMQKIGGNIDITVYENSHHSFDRSAPPEISEDAYSFTDCRIRIRADGAALMNFLDIPMTTPLLQKIGLAFCADRGPTFGGNPKARARSFKFAEDFMGKHLLKN